MFVKIGVTVLNSFRIKMASITAVLIAGIIAVSGSVPAHAVGSDDLAWIGTNATVSGGDGLLTKYSGAVNPTVSVPAPLGYVLATDNTYLYFISNGSLVKTNLDGTGQATVLANLAGQTPALTSVLGLTISAGNIFLVDGTAGVFKYPLSGGSLTKVNNGGISVNGATQGLAAQLIVATSTTLYWGESDGLHNWTIGGTPGSEGTVKPNSDFDTLSGLNSNGYVYSLAQESNNLVITTISGTGNALLFQLPSGGSWAFIITLPSAMYAAGLAMSPTTIYYTDFGGSVFSVSRTGTNPATVFSYSNDSEAVVWVNPSVTPPAPSPTPVTPELPNTGADYSVAIAFMLLAITTGISLLITRRNIFRKI